MENAQWLTDHKRIQILHNPLNHRIVCGSLFAIGGEMTFGFYVIINPEQNIEARTYKVYHRRFECGYVYCTFFGAVSVGCFCEVFSSK